MASPRLRKQSRIGKVNAISSLNPTLPQRNDSDNIYIFVFEYDAATVEEHKLAHVTECYPFLDNNKTNWINVDGIRKADVESLCNHFGVHYLIQQGIQTVGQRPKMEEIEGILFCVCNMLFYNEQNFSIEQEQVSIVLGKNFLISFQDDPNKDFFSPIREKLKIDNSKIRQSGPDFLCYAMLDMVVDNYFLVMEKFGEHIEYIEDEIQNSKNNNPPVEINMLRNQMILLKRSMAPMRGLINGFVQTDSILMNPRTTKYFRDVYDHVSQVNDLLENYRDITMNLQDMYLNNVNLRMNEVMKLMAIVTCLLAPPAIITGIFGMNFDKVPLEHGPYGFWIAASAMVIIPLVMMAIFKKRGWF